MLIENNAILSEGIWDFKVIQADEKIAKNGGHSMLLLKITVADENGKTANIDQFISSGNAKDFCMATGLMDAYNKKELKETDCEGKEGRCVGGIKAGDVKKINLTDGRKIEAGFYPDKNVIFGFLPNEDKKETEKDDFLNDDINF